MSTSQKIAEHIAALCGVGGDRHPGTSRNRAATTYALGEMQAMGLETEELEFDVPEWRYSAASVRVGDAVVDAHPSPFSPPVESTGRLVAVSHASELDNLETPGAVLLLHGEIAKVQLTPRDYPWYSNPEDTAIIDALERIQPLAVIAATGKNPAMTAALSPFPLIEEVGFSVPSAYITAEQGEQLASAVGSEVEVRIDSEIRPSTGVQPVGRLRGSGVGRVVVAAHIDTKPDTPGALDNAAGVATLLAVAELLADKSRGAFGIDDTDAPGPSVEFVPFNGEDHTMSPGEIVYLAAHPDLSDVRLMINIDGAGLVGALTACSTYGLDEEAAALVERCLGESATVKAGPEWPASDHMIFAMRGVPSIALVTADVDRAMDEIVHTAADTPDVVDPDLLVDAARFVADMIRGL